MSVAQAVEDEVRVSVSDALEVVLRVVVERVQALELGLVEELRKRGVLVADRLAL